MQAAGFLEQKKRSPIGFALVVLAHLAVLTALALASTPQFIRDRLTTIVTPIPVPPEPPPEPPRETRETRTPQQTYTAPLPPFQPPIDDGPVTPPQPPQPPDPLPPRDPVVRADPPAPRIFPPQRARASLSSYFSTDDYPAAAIRLEAQGTTRFALTIGSDGRVTNCSVTGSSGNSALDAATCRILRARARYTPARDQSNNPTSGTDRGSITWRLPAD